MARLDRAGQTCCDRGVDIPGPSLGQAAIECRRVAARLGGGHPGGQVIRHDGVEQGAGRRDQRQACAEQLVGAARCPPPGRDLAEPGQRECHASGTAKLLPGAQRVDEQCPGRRRRCLRLFEAGVQQQQGQVPLVAAAA